MLLLDGGGPKGAKRIAACWARPSQSRAGRLQAGLDQAQERGAV
jgi:hypothetical protein